MQYVKKRFQSKVKVQRRAIDILYEKMIFYHDKAFSLYEDIKELVEKGNNAALIVALHKDMHKFNDIVIECAARLAPYQTAKLQNIEVKQKVEHKFVIKVPITINDPNKWLEIANSHMPPPQLKALPPPYLNGKADNIVEVDNTDNYIDMNNT